eukprot:10932869-Alexandrium_andersonii.AAC.1
MQRQTWNSAENRRTPHRAAFRSQFAAASCASCPGVQVRSWERSVLLSSALEPRRNGDTSQP